MSNFGFLLAVLSPLVLVFLVVLNWAGVFDG